jgi:hypothetical protein
MSEKEIRIRINRNFDEYAKSKESEAKKLRMNESDRKRQLIGICWSYS